MSVSLFVLYYNVVIDEGKFGGYRLGESNGPSYWSPELDRLTHPVSVMLDSGRPMWCRRACSLGNSRDSQFPRGERRAELSMLGLFFLNSHIREVISLSQEKWIGRQRVPRVFSSAQRPRVSRENVRLVSPLHGRKHQDKTNKFSNSFELLLLSIWGKYFGDWIKKFDGMWGIKERKDLKRMPWATDSSSWVDGNIIPWLENTGGERYWGRKVMGSVLD